MLITSAIGVSAVSYWSFLRGEIVGCAIGAFLSGASVVAFMYEARGTIKKT